MPGDHAPTCGRDEVLRRGSNYVEVTKMADGELNIENTFVHNPTTAPRCLPLVVLAKRAWQSRRSSAGTSVLRLCPATHFPVSPSGLCGQLQFRGPNPGSGMDAGDSFEGPAPAADLACNGRRQVDRGVDDPGHRQPLSSAPSLQRVEHHDDDVAEVRTSTSRHPLTGRGPEPIQPTRATRVAQSRFENDRTVSAELLPRRGRRVPGELRD